MPIPLGFGPALPPPPVPVVGTSRYHHVIEAAFGTAPPGNPNNTVTPPGVLNVGGWTQLSGWYGYGLFSGPFGSDGIIRPLSNPILDITATRTMKNKSTGEAEPGTAKFDLLGDNGWLDPTNPNSPYAGYLVPGVPIRCRTTDGKGNFWPDFRGFVSRWPQSQGQKQLQHAVIECYGPLGWLGAAVPLYPTELQKVILASGPSSYWPMNDPGGTTTRDIVAGFDAVLRNGATLNGPSLTVDNVGVSADFASAQSAAFADSFGGYFEPPPAAMPAFPFTVSFLLMISANPIADATYTSGGNEVIFRMFGAGGYQYLSASMGAVSVYVPGSLSASVITPWIGFTSAPFTHHLTQGGPYLLTFTYDAAGTLTTFIDGVRRNSVAAAPVTNPSPTGFLWGAVDITGVTSFPSATMQMSHMAIWSRVLADSEVAAMSTAAHNSRSGESTSDRTAYLLDRYGWPASLRQLDPGFMKVGPLDLSNNPSGLDLVKQAVQYEDGLLCETADGKILTWGRGGNLDPARFAVGGYDANVPGGPLEQPVFATNDITLVTSASVGVPPVIYTGGTSLANGHPVDMKQVAANGDDAWLTAQRAVQLGTTARPGVDSVTLDPVDTSQALTMDLASLGTVRRHPLWSPTVLVEPQQVTSVTSTGGAGKLLKRTFSMLKPRGTQWHLHCPGVNLSGASSPASSKFDVPSGVITVECFFRVASWTSTATQILLGHANPGTGAGWLFAYQGYVPRGHLAWIWADNAGTYHALGSTEFSLTGTRYVWVRCVFNPSAGVATFDISNTNRNNYVTWGSVGSGPGYPGGPTTIKAAGTSALQIGDQGGGGNPLAGDVLQAFVSTTGGSTAFDPTADNQPGASSWTSSTGEGWSLMGSGLLLAG